MTTRAGWTLPAALIGGAAAATGFWLLDTAPSEVFDSCSPRQIWDIGVKAEQGTDQLCVGTPASFFTGYVLLAAGALLLLAAVIGLFVRAARSAREGAPWAVHRWLTRIAHRVDRAMHGERDEDDDGPWFGAGVVATVLTVALVGAVVGGVKLWQHHEQSVRHDRLVVAQRALAGLALPASLQPLKEDPRRPCAIDAGQRCLTSSLSPRATVPEVVAMLHGRITNDLCAKAAAVRRSFCTIFVSGTVHGFPAVADIGRSIFDVAAGQLPPAGATHINGTRQAYPGGTRVVIYLLTDDTS